MPDLPCCVIVSVAGAAGLYRSVGGQVDRVCVVRPETLSVSATDSLSKRKVLRWAVE